MFNFCNPLRSVFIWHSDVKTVCQAQWNIKSLLQVLPNRTFVSAARRVMRSLCTDLTVFIWSLGIYVFYLWVATICA